jgi:hypothetical protein
MTSLETMQVALAQLRTAVEDDPSLLPIRLSASVLANAVVAAGEGINAARVNDIAFALNDLVASVDEAGAPDAICEAVALLQNDTAVLRRATALPSEVVQSLRDLQSRLRTRGKALERSQYRIEGTEAAPLPHPPEELRELAIPLGRQLLAAGFDTPALDELIAHPQSLRYHSINELVDELDVIAGAGA